MKTPVCITVLAIATLVGGSSAHAETIDFKAMADGSHGESAWDPLVLTLADFVLTVKGTASGNDAWAYLDSNNAGLGVCPALDGSPAAGMKHPNSKANLCDPSSDDNVKQGEILHFMFDTNVIIEAIYFNNNHDSDHSLAGDTINIGGSSYALANAGGGEWLKSGPFAVAADTSFNIFWETDQFYVSKMVVTAVPEPTSGLLIATALVALAARRRSRRA
jgi:hypothetical protein